MKVLVVHDEVPPGAPPDQQDVLIQVELVREILAADGHDVAVHAFEMSLGPLRTHAPDLVFNLVECVGGDGRLAHLFPAVLETLGLPFTGSSAAGIAVTTDKALTKVVLQAHGIAVPPDFPAGGPRWIVKSRFEEASIGLDDDNVVTADRIEAAIARLAPRLGGSTLVETYIEGREIQVSVLDGPDGPRALPVAEILFDLPPGREHMIGYAAKWDVGSVEYVGTPRTFDVEGIDVERLARQSLLAFEALNLRGYARIDWRVAEDGTPYVLEVNANPCISPDAGFMEACGQAGISQPEAIRAVCARALIGR